MFVSMGTVLGGAIVGAATGFISGFIFFWACPINYPYWAALVGLPVGALVFSLPKRYVQTIVGTIWIASILGLVVGLILNSMQR